MMRAGTHVSPSGISKRRTTLALKLEIIPQAPRTTDPGCSREEETPAGTPPAVCIQQHLVPVDPAARHLAQYFSVQSDFSAPGYASSVVAITPITHPQRKLDHATCWRHTLTRLSTFANVSFWVGPRFSGSGARSRFFSPRDHEAHV